MKVPQDDNNYAKYDISDDLKKIQLEYEKTIPKKLQDFLTLHNEAKKNPSLENLNALRFFVHKLAGSAGTYGFTQVSTICKKYELELLDVLKAPANLKWMNAWDGYYDQVTREFPHG